MPINSFLYPGAKFTPAYEVANSCRFDDGSSDNLTITPSGDGNMRTWTYSGWVKRGNLGAWGGLIFAGIAGTIVHLCINTAYKLTDLSVLQPVNFSRLLIASFFGFIIFAALNIALA